MAWVYGWLSCWDIREPRFNWMGWDGEWDDGNWDGWVVISLRELELSEPERRGPHSQPGIIAIKKGFAIRVRQKGLVKGSGKRAQAKGSYG